ncbi:MAG: hypothetical protein ACYC0H_20500 [Solirubrobacteraceae bacterium]
MDLQGVLAPGPRRWLLLALVGLCAVGGGVAYAAVRSGNAGSGGTISTESTAMFHRAMVARMRAEHLDYRWIACVPSGKHFEGVRVVRCNVDFGEPHIVAYCSVLRGGRLLTSKDDPAIPCGHDNAGFSDSVVQYG